MSDAKPHDARREQAEAVRQACIDAALAAWEDAGISGLCAEGRWEMAIQAMRQLDLAPALRASRDEL